MDDCAEELAKKSERLLGEVLSSVATTMYLFSVLGIIGSL
jgi:hypothetical protein